MSFSQKKLLTVSIIAAATVASILVFPSAFSQEFVSISDKPTIKVTGDASLKLQPDQAVIRINMQSTPTDLTSALDEQKQGAERLASAIKTAVGNDPDTTVLVGRTYLNPINTGQSYSDINVFAIFASTEVEIDLDGFSDLVKKLAEEDYGFESVHASPYMLQAASADSSFASGEEVIVPEEIPDDAARQITINVVVNTKPDTLNNVLDEYEQKYKRLLEVLQEFGIASDKIKPANVNVRPMYYGPGKSTSYSTYSQVFVKTSSANVEKISQVVQNEDAYMDDVFLTISDSMIENVREKLNREAFNNAKARAESLAQMTGLKIKGVQSIEMVTDPVASPRSDVISYNGVYVMPPNNYRDITGEIGVSMTVEFEVGR